MLDLDRFVAAPLVRDPFDHLILHGFLHPPALAAVLADFPDVAAPGLFPVSALARRGAFARLVDAIRDPALGRAFGEKFGLSLAGRPLLITVRGLCHPRDGSVHTDSRSKLVSALLYLNDGWEESGGRLRLLRSGNIDDVAAEVPPEAGTLVVFRRSERSFHGHLPFAGARRYIMLNWLTGLASATRETARHRLSAGVKHLASRLLP